MTTDEYERGLAEGQLRARLDDHGRRLDVVNGSIAKTGEALASLTAAVAELTVVSQASERRAAKYVPVLEAIEQRSVRQDEEKRVLGLKRWHVAAGGIAVVLPQLLNLCLRLYGVS